MSTNRRGTLYKILEIIVGISKQNFSINSLVQDWLFDEEAIRFRNNREYSSYKAEIISKAINVAIVFTLLGVFIIFVLIYKMLRQQYRTGQLQNFTNQLLSSQQGRMTGTLILLFIGIILFYFKKKQQLYYGIFETAFALASSYILTDNIQRTILKGRIDVYIMLPIMTSIYLIVRGLSNISEGTNKPFFLKNLLSKQFSEFEETEYNGV